MTVQQFANQYEKFSKAQKYILGFVVAHRIYMVMTDNIPSDYLAIEKASRNQGENLRLRMKSAQCKALIEQAICLGEDNLLISEKYNRGEIFEKLVTEHYNQEWKKDTIPFYVQGDINIDGVEIQIKLNSATLVNTKMLAKLSAQPNRAVRQFHQKKAIMFIQFDY